MRIGLRYAVEVGLVADSRKALEDLIPHLKRNKNRRSASGSFSFQFTKSRQNTPLPGRHTPKTLRNVQFCTFLPDASWHNFPVAKGENHDQGHYVV
jgi:thiamine pyrophosphate-dependent acetolactate synthase large subunit-like protein